MGTFFYDSLDTLQKVTFPTRQDYISLTLSVIVTIIIAGALFIGMDSLFSGIYRGAATALRQEKTAQGKVATGALQGL
jgi:preprotein translocase SecE subunit